MKRVRLEIRGAVNAYGEQVVHFIVRSRKRQSSYVVSAEFCFDAPAEFNRNSVRWAWRAFREGWRTLILGKDFRRVLADAAWQRSLKRALDGGHR